MEAFLLCVCGGGVQELSNEEIQQREAVRVGQIKYEVVWGRVEQKM